MGLFISQMQVRQSDRRNGPYSLRWALAEDIIDADPCGGIKKPVPLEASRNVVLNEDQLKAFWLGLDAAPMEPDTRTALKLSLVTAPSLYFRACVLERMSRLSRKMSALRMSLIFRCPIAGLICRFSIPRSSLRECGL